MVRRFGLWLLLTMVMLCVPGPALHAQAASVAIVMDRQGDVDVLSGGRRARLGLLDYLPADAELALPRGATGTLVYLATSQEWVFNGPGRYRMAAGQPQVLEGAAPVARSAPRGPAGALQRMEPAQRERMTLGAVVMRAVGPLRLVSPDSADLLPGAPTLLWQNPNAQRVRVTVQSSVTGGVVAQTELADERWTLPAGLPPGDYSWRVEAASDATTRTRIGRFRVVDSSDPRVARFAATADSFADRLARAMLLEADELPHDALLLWRALAAERPAEDALKPWLR